MAESDAERKIREALREEAERKERERERERKDQDALREIQDKIKREGG
jgi:hypothetical protein